MYYSLSLVGEVPLPPPTRLSIKGNIPNVNKTLNTILQNSWSEKISTKPHVWRRQGRLILCPSIDLLDQLNIALAYNIGHVSDKSLHVYITLTAMKFYFIIKSLFSIRFFQKHLALAVD